MTRTAVVLVATFNRAAHLSRLLDTLARQRVGSDLAWSVLIIDNNSSDGTARVVHERAASYPAPLEYLFEPAQGKSLALNAGLRATKAECIAFTDDDVEVPERWVDAAVRPLLTRADIAYTGGPVRPIWSAPKPAWLDDRGNAAGTIGVMDFGADSFIFEERRRVALGNNMAVRRTLIDRIGGFRPEFGRRGELLLGQEQAEFFHRSRAAGARGLYVPDMALGHHVPVARLTRAYFWRWWYWKGRSQARLRRLHPTTELGVDLSAAPRIMGVPRWVLGDALRETLAWVRSRTAGDPVGAASHEMRVAYAMGYCRDCLSLNLPARRLAS
jgi:glycosyltransferase involved in cell wall biosynthesis